MLLSNLQGDCFRFDTLVARLLLLVSWTGSDSVSCGLVVRCWASGGSSSDRVLEGGREDGMFIGSCIVSVLVLERVSISLLLIYRSHITRCSFARLESVLRMAKLIFCDTSTNSTPCHSTAPTSTRHTTLLHSVNRNCRRVLSTRDRHFDDWCSTTSNPSQRPSIRSIPHSDL